MISFRFPGDNPLIATGIAQSDIQVGKMAEERIEKYDTAQWFVLLNDREASPRPHLYRLYALHEMSAVTTLGLRELALVDVYILFSAGSGVGWMDCASARVFLQVPPELRVFADEVFELQGAA